MLALASLECALVLASPAVAGGGKHAAMILDANTGAVLHADQADELRHPASLTKMMTLYMAFETLESGRMSMSDRVKISQEAASQAPSKLDLEPGESLSVSDTIRALVTKSANDVAVALAEKIGGSERNFVRLMNVRARDLGMTKTHFENASGLPHNEQVTTARDMITLGLRLQDDFPSYYPLFATRSFTFNRATYRNHNTLLNSFQGMDGIKTGYTGKSGFNLVSSVRRGGRHVVGAVFGGSSAASRNGEMRNLLTRALARASTQKTRKPASQLIAKLKSAPKIAERPKLKEAPALVSAPKAVAKPFAQPALQTAQAMPQPKPLAQARSAPAAIPAAAPIDVFKVKRVIVAPRQGPNPPMPNADETTDMPVTVTTAARDEEAGRDDGPQAENSVAAQAAAATPEPATVDSITAALSLADDAPKETVIPKTRVAAPPATSAPVATASLPSPLGNRIAMLGARDVPSEQTTELKDPQRIANPQSARTIPAPRPTAFERGRAPSSLQLQAARLPSAAPQRVAALQPASYDAPANPTPASRYEIQIGAFGTIDEAQRALTSTQSRTGPLLNGYGSVTHPVQKAGRIVYRARFSGFDAGRASSTCTELRRQSIDCFVMTAE